MNISDTLGSSLQSIISHPLRSIMTVTAIVIGIFAVVVMFSSVQGIKEIIKVNTEAMGINDSIMIYPGYAWVYSSGQNRLLTQGIHPPTLREPKPLDYNDYISLQQNVEYKSLYGMITRWYDNHSFPEKERVQVIATNEDYLSTNMLELKEGRLFNNFEISKKSKVCLLGSSIVDKHYPEQDVLGKNVTINENTYVVVGVVSKQTGNTGMVFFGGMGRDQLNTVFIPLTTGIELLTENKSIDNLVIQSKDQQSYNDTKNRVRQILLANHNMSPDFMFYDIGSYVAETLSQLEDFLKKWNITLTAIASISLIVGGLGLFSTMLISIGEKLLEIGIRKSVGASPGSIFSHFLVESVIFSMIGAAIGISLSSLSIKVVSLVTKVDFPIVIEGVLLGIGFALFIGLVSGLYPAIKAAKINPIQAIYYDS